MGNQNSSLSAAYQRLFPTAVAKNELISDAMNHFTGFQGMYEAHKDRNSYPRFFPTIAANPNRFEWLVKKGMTYVATSTARNGFLAGLVVGASLAQEYTSVANVSADAKYFLGAVVATRALTLAGSAVIRPSSVKSVRDAAELFFLPVKSSINHTVSDARTNLVNYASTIDGSNDFSAVSDNLRKLVSDGADQVARFARINHAALGAVAGSLASQYDLLSSQAQVGDGIACLGVAAMISLAVNEFRKDSESQASRPMPSVIVDGRPSRGLSDLLRR